MKNKKVTMKDIAKVANVSLATVSYVLNKAENHKISNETREKILHIADELCYVPNYAAKILAQKKSNLIGIIINKNHNKYNKFIYYDFASELQQVLADADYDVVITSTNNIVRDIDVISKRGLEAVFIIDIGEEQFIKISNRCIVPLILIDSIVEDTMFYRIIPNMLQAVKKAKIELNTNSIDYIITEQFNNGLFMDSIKELCNDIYIYNNDDELLNFVKQNNNKKGLIIGEILSSRVMRYGNPENIVTICFFEDELVLDKKDKRLLISNRDKAVEAVELMEKLIKRNFEKEKNILINCR